MSSTVEQVKEDLRIYESIENSPLGPLLKEGRMYIGLSSKKEQIELSWHPMGRNYEYCNKLDYNMTDEELDKLLDAIQPNLSLIEKTEESISVDSKYGFVVFSIDEEKGKTLLFGTAYNIHLIYDVRYKNGLLPTT